MLNHARTLLLNVSGPWLPGELGEEFIPADYVAVRLPEAVRAIRTVLFGVDPDRTYLNYRARQLLTLLHSTELESHVLALDPRITYWPEFSGDWFTSDGTPTVTKISGPDVQSAFAGSFYADDMSGKCRHGWLLTCTTEGVVRIRRTVAPHTEQEIEFTTSGGMTPLLPLPGSGLLVRLSHGRPGIGAEGFVGLRMLIDFVGRPQADLGQLDAVLRAAVDVSQINAVFHGNAGQRLVEPFTTFKRLWHEHPLMPYRLGGLVLGCIYRTEALRV